MTYEVVDIESGDVLADFATLRAAKESVSSYLDRHGQQVADLAIAELDDRGKQNYLRPVSEFLGLP